MFVIIAFAILFLGAYGLPIRPMAKNWKLYTSRTLILNCRNTLSNSGSSVAQSLVIHSKGGRFLGDVKLASVSILLQFSKKLIHPTFIGGLLSGSLHAITGPDHIAALLPSSVGQSARSGMNIGAIWGLGHGMSAILLGLTAFYVKGRMGGTFCFLERLSSFAELAVGVSLLSIGGIGVRESLDLIETNTDGHGDGEILEGLRISAMKSYRAIFANGLLHGCSFDGAPSLAPALAMTSWGSVLSFLVAYCIGTMTAMSIAAGAVGEGSIRLGEAIGSNKLPRQLSLGSSILAILIGLYWIMSFIFFK